MENKIAVPVIIILIVLIIIFASMYWIKEPKTEIIGEKEIIDTDNDGYPDDIDAFPDNPNEWVDTDGDGCGDNSDAFPNDPNEVWDSDNDGIGRNTDLYDFGNAGIRIYIEHCFVYNHIDEEDNDPDPYFIIKMDLESNGTWDYSWESMVYYDRDVSVYDIDISKDVRDDLENITFIIEVWDKDQFTDDEIMDYSEYPEYYWDIHDVKLEGHGINSYPFSERYESDGSEDGNSGENDLSLIYYIAVTEIE